MSSPSKWRKEKLTQDLGWKFGELNVKKYVKYLAQSMAYSKRSINGSFYYTSEPTDLKDMASKELSKERSMHGEP